MPALNFQSQFAPKILAGGKPFTLRAIRADGRDPKIGQPLYLFTSMRTKKCKKFAEKACRFAINIKLSYRLIEIPGFKNLTSPDQLELFSERDGFDSYAEFSKFHEITACMTPKPMRLISWLTRDELKRELVLFEK